MAAESMGLGIPWKIACSVLDLRYGRFTGRTASDVKSAIPAYSDDSLRGYDDRDRNLFEEKYVGKEELMELFRKFRAIINIGKASV